VLGCVDTNERQSSTDFPSTTREPAAQKRKLTETLAESRLPTLPTQELQEDEDACTVDEINCMGAHKGARRGAIGGGRGQWLGGTMASAEHERITGSGVEPPAGSRGRAPRPLKLKAFLIIGCPTEPTDLAPLSVLLL